jgi:hypothetical protein
LSGAQASLTAGDRRTAADSIAASGQVVKLLRKIERSPLSDLKIPVR